MKLMKNCWLQNIAGQLEKRSKNSAANRISIGSLALKSKSFQFSDRRLKFVSSNPIPKNLIKMSEEVKTDAAPAEAPTAEDLKGQKRSLEVRISFLPAFYRSFQIKFFLGFICRILRLIF